MTSEGKWQLYIGIPHDSAGACPPLSPPPDGGECPSPEPELRASSSEGSRWYDGLLNDAPITYTVPAAISAPATKPPTIWPCGPAKEMVKPLGTGQDGVVWGRNVAQMERMSKRPWKVTVAPGVVEG